MSTTATTQLEGRKEDDDRLPVTVLSGFLGAGKTSVLQNILHSKEHGLKIAVIVNDMAAVNVDAQAVKKVAPKLVSMQNGCICCTLREDLLEQVTELSKERDTDGTRKWEYLVIESTGISEPLPVAQTFVMEVAEDEEHDHDHDHEHQVEEQEEEKKGADDEDQEMSTEEEGEAMPVLAENPLLKYARLDTMVTVVDACGFFESMGDIQRIKDQPDAVGDEDPERTLADLMVDQVEFADVILLNKCDTMIEKKKESELESVEQLLKTLNPNANVIRTNYGKVPFDKMLNTKLFDMDKAMRSAGWLAELAKPAHTPETEEYGVSSLVFRANKPFHPVRLQATLDAMQEETSTFNGVIRSKGQIWLANAHACGFMWHTAGYNFTFEPRESPYMASVVEEHLNVPYLGKASPAKVDRAFHELYGTFEGALDEIDRLRKEGQWTDEFGDRNQELVLIGVNLDKPRMQEELEKVLLTDEEMKAGMKNLDNWKALEDPFFGGNCVEEFWDLPPAEEEEEEGEEEE